MPFGFTEWFRMGEHARTDAALDAMQATGAKFLRTHLSWAEYHTPGGQAWYDWLLPRIAARFELLPCIHYTPPSLSRTGTTAGAPQRLRDYADFVDHALTRYGSHFRSIELWNEPNNLLDWDWREDREWLLFCEMVGSAAYWARQRGFGTVLAGLSPYDSEWLRLMGERGILGQMTAVGVHGFPGTWDSALGSWDGWARLLSTTRGIIDQYNPAAEIWITEAGYSTWRHDEAEQARSFADAIAAPADRLYWYGWQDIPDTISVQEGLRFDGRHYHMGVVDAAGTPKLLGRLLAAGGPARLASTMQLAAPSLRHAAEPVVVAGGAGFIGCNLADSFLQEGRDVVLIDNLSRHGVDQNLAWLKDRHGSRVSWAAADIRDQHAMRDIIRDAGAVFHFAAQVAVTTSLDAPVEDFEVNARGTLNMLEAVRQSGRRIPLIFASTNKVYGNLTELGMREQDDRYVPVDEAIAAHGIGEDHGLDFCTPYGCSKGIADQYVMDYARSFGLLTAVLRMSCVYGPRQFGTEDQGWIAHFLIRALDGDALTIYGDGKQVRDVLHIDDAVAAYRAVHAAIDDVSGQAFNLGGGATNAVSLQMVLREIERLIGSKPKITYGETRKGDQTYFVSDTRKLSRMLGWTPAIGWRDGLRDLYDWMSTRRATTRGAAAPRALHLAQR
jgi:CDP-paratose 2-epimerase